MIANDIRYDKNLYIRELQSALRDLHFLYPNELPLINIDGIFGAETTEAVLAAQRLGGREATGVVDFETWSWLFAVRRAGFKESGTVELLGRSIRTDDEDAIAAAVQRLLFELESTFPNLVAPPPSGKMDSLIKLALENFQDAAQLPPDEIPDEERLRLLMRLYTVYTS